MHFCATSAAAPRRGRASAPASDRARTLKMWAAILILCLVNLGICAPRLSSAPPQRPGPAKLPPIDCAQGQRRVSCAAAKLNAPPASTPSPYIIDGPFVGNGNLGAALSADEGLQFWLGANNMWSTNTAPDHGLCDAAASKINPTHSGSVYTLIGVGKLALEAAPFLQNTSFAAEMNLEKGSLGANLTADAAGLRTYSFVAADKDALVVRLDVDMPLTLTIAVSVPESASTVVSGHAPWVLPTEAGHEEPDGMYAARQGVNAVDNNVVLNMCGRGGQHASAQSFSLSENGDLTLSDGRCLVLTNVTTGPDCPSSTRRITIGDCERNGRSPIGWIFNASARTLSMLEPQSQRVYYAVLAPAPPPAPSPAPGPAPVPMTSEPGYILFPGAVGGQGNGGRPVCNCTSVLACPGEAAAQCNASSTCHSFAVYAHHQWNGCQMYDKHDTEKRYNDTGWNLWAKTSAFVDHANDYGPNLFGVPTVSDSDTDAFSPVPFVIASTSSAGTQWRYNHTTGFLSVGELPRNLARGMPGGDACLTYAEPNRNLNSAIGVKIVNASGHSDYLDPVQIDTNDEFESNMTVKLVPGRTQYLVAAVHVCCKGCDAIGTPQCDSTVVGNGAVARALQLAADVSAQAEQEQHATVRWWDAFWNASSINLGPSYRQIEQFYYGMQYTVGAASRPGRMAPGLWGPWITTDGAVSVKFRALNVPATSLSESISGWNGDYTINYNFQAIFYGVFSDNRPHLALPYFPIIEQMIDLGKWRAAVDWLPRAGKCSLPGAFTNYFEKWPDPDGGRATPRGETSSGTAANNGTRLAGINFPGHFSAFPELYYPNDMGQKSDAVFAGMHFIKYYDTTGNRTFLAHHAYPYLRLVADFYESYMTLNPATRRYDVLNSCAMEGCGEQPLGGNVASNNPPFDIGPARTLFRKLVEYSAELGVDTDRRAKWSDYAQHLASFPTTRDPMTGKIVIDQQETPLHCISVPGSNTTPAACFPSVEHPGNARYPITFFAGIHPGDAISLGDEPKLVQAARDTVEAVNAVNWWSPTNGLCMAWPPASRVSNDAEVTLAHFDKALNSTLQPNLWPWIENRPTGGWGCPVEQAGATLAINDLLVQGHEGFLRLFPAGWSSTPASFTTLRVPGAFLVSAATDGGGIPKDVELVSLAGRNCSVMLPKGWSSVVVRKLDGAHNSFLPVKIVRHIGFLGSGLRADHTKLYEFQTVTGEKYSLADGGLLPGGVAPMSRVSSYQSFGVQ